MLSAKLFRIVLLLVVTGVTAIIGCSGVDPDNPRPGSISAKKDALKGAEVKEKATSTGAAKRGRRAN